MISAVHPSRRWGFAAAGWSATFAGVHLYWALGGSVRLAESAGRQLAEARPGWFVSFGLYGVAALLVAAAVLGVVLARRALTGPRRLLLLLAAGVATVLLARGVVVEVLLLTNPGYGGGAISGAQRWWAPWFLLGGVAFAMAARARRRSR